ncbi:hypothetical protein BJY04DRAFT_186716 [Aspergillus karnatakaensis]|uniref:SDR family oxidoreductase n=1 Tax=Aspergillus karnatakaensis TaxID=1810916 RepID=UPI003CCD9A83
MRVILETIFHLLSATKDLLLQPILPGSILLALSHGPSQLRNAILETLAKHSTITPHQFKSTLSVFLLLGAVRVGNGFLSRLAANNWQLRSPVPWNWSSEIAVVTGGCGGIGRVIVEGLARRGITVVVLDIQDLPQELSQNKLVKYYQCDLTSAQAISEVASAIRNQIGHPSILVNNAGLGSVHGILETSDEHLHKIFRINLFCHWSATREFLPTMIQRNKGHIVTVASMGSFVTVGTSVDYSATKAGALAFHEGLGNELRYIYKSPGVLTTVVHPNYVQTPMTSMNEYRFVRQGTMLRAEDVGNRVVKQILSRQGGQLVLPDYLTLVTPALRGWPTWLQDGLRDAISKPVIAGLA